MYEQIKIYIYVPQEWVDSVPQEWIDCRPHGRYMYLPAPLRNLGHTYNETFVVITF